MNTKTVISESVKKAKRRNLTQRDLHAGAIPASSDSESDDPSMEVSLSSILKIKQQVEERREGQQLVKKNKRRETSSHPGWDEKDVASKTKRRCAVNASKRFNDLGKDMSDNESEISFDDDDADPDFEIKPRKSQDESSSESDSEAEYTPITSSGDKIASQSDTTHLSSQEALLENETTYSTPSAQETKESDSPANMFAQFTREEDTTETLDQMSTSWLSLGDIQSPNQLLDAFGDIDSQTIQVPDQDEQRGESNSGIISVERGRKRKRKTAEERADEEIERLMKIKAKHCVLEGCNDKCPKKCVQFFTEKERQDINSMFWKKDWVSQRQYVRQCVLKTDCKERVAPNSVDKKPIAKSCTYKYTMRMQNGIYRPVCKKFFLATFGFKANNDKIIRSALRDVQINQNNDAPPLEDRRGKHEPKHKISHKLVHEHVEKYKPSISHYRREHAPLRRYLSSDLTLKEMHKNFCETSGRQVSMNFYYKAFKELNISFAVLGQEECETCHQFFLHKQRCECEVVCEHYSAFVSHRKKYRMAREMYQHDTMSEAISSCPTFAADLQKVILIPRMDQFKSNIFTSRLVVFNETFSPVGSRKLNKTWKDKTFIWNESVAGRKDEDVTSTFHTFLKTQRDAQHVTIWLDNCSSQNKNWTLYTMIVHAVNDENFTENKLITLKYFEPGHTFMAADSTHAKIEKVLKRKDGKIFDFDDFRQCVEEADCHVHIMATEDFADWESGASNYLLGRAQPRPYLSRIVWAEFRRGSPETLFFKENFSDREASACSFIKKGYDPTPKIRQKPRGVAKEKKDNILQKLVPLMPHNRRSFWEDLPVSLKSKDLATALV